MSRVFTNELFAQEAEKWGMFSAVIQFLEEGSITEAFAIELLQGVYKLYAAKVREARQEVHRLHAVLERMEHVCSEGVRARHAPGSAQQVQHLRRLAHEATTFDNWVVSLYESDITMIWWANPERANAKPTEFANSMAALRMKRIANIRANLKDPSLFKRG